VKKKEGEEAGEESSESSDESSDESSGESDDESASPSSELSPNEVLNSVEEGEEVAPLFVLRPESVPITAKITARADAARAAAGRVWRDVQASRAVSSPEALEKAKALNAAATARAKALRDEKRERGEPLSDVGSDDTHSAVAPADLLRRRREARGVFADPNAAQTESRARRGLNPRAEGASRRVRAYAERRRDGADLSPRARVGHALVAGPGVDANTALSEEARAKLAAAAARKRARGRGVGFADSMAEMRGFGGRGGSGSRRGASRGGPGGGGSGGGSDARSARNSRRGRDGDSLDEKTRAALAARVEEARRASASESPWEWDVATFESGARKTFGENFNVAEYASAPVVPGFGVESNVTASSSEVVTTSAEDAFLESKKAFIQRQGGIASDAQFESVKRDALKSFARYKSLYEKQRLTKGESPIEGDFLAERRTLLDAVEGVSETNPLRSFATRAADALDGNAGWSYARKVAALRFLASKAERYENAESAE
jgi:hypothetical protein